MGVGRGQRHMSYTCQKTSACGRRHIWILSLQHGVWSKGMWGGGFPSSFLFWLISSGDLGMRYRN